MKKFFGWALKAFVAGCIAFALLCGFCMLWYNIPVHYDNPTGATEYVWESRKFYSKGTEGFALGRTNNEGFNNLKDYSEGEDIHILLMGSSHMEGFNVAQDECAAAVINTLFAGKKYCYNIGTAGHHMLYCVSNLPAALERYAPKEYVVIETFKIDYSAEEMMSVVDGSLAPIPSHSGGIVGLMQKLPYLRLFYTQHFKGGGEAFGDTAAAAAAPAAKSDPLPAQGMMLDMVAESCQKQGVQPIIVYNSSVLIKPDGSAYTATDAERLQQFAGDCEERGIIFINLCPRFLELYESDSLLPYGFSNTSPGGGHMNKTGHRLFAEAVRAAIEEREG